MYRVHRCYHPGATLVSLSANIRQTTSYFSEFRLSAGISALTRAGGILFVSRVTNRATAFLIRLRASLWTARGSPLQRDWEP